MLIFHKKLLKAHENYMKKKLSTFLVIIGILLMLVPFASEFYVKYKQEKLYKEMLEKIEKAASEAANNDSSSSDTDIEDSVSDHEAIPDNALNVDETIVDIMDENFSEAIIQVEDNESKKEEKTEPNLNVIGRVEIKRLGIDLIIIEGSSQYVLMYGAGHMDKTAYPGDFGNFVLAGHRGYAGATFFYRLHKVKIDDVIKITYDNKEYNYSVTDNYKVLPNDLSVLKQTKDTKELTLITCDPPVTGTHRIIIKALLIEDEDKSED